MSMEHRQAVQLCHAPRRPRAPAREIGLPLALGETAIFVLGKRPAGRRPRIRRAP